MAEASGARLRHCRLAWLKGAQVRLTLTSLLDLAGLLALVAALMVALWPLSVALAFVAGGAGLLTVSWFLDYRARPPKQTTEVDA